MDKDIEKYLLEIERVIGSRIEHARIMLRMSRKELAKAINVSQQQLYKYEKNKNRISVGRLNLIANRFKKDLNYFIN